MAKAFDPYHVWLGIPPQEQPANHYCLLGINPFESDPEVIDNAADRQMVHLRSFQLGKYSDLSQTLLNEVAAANLCLLRPEKRAAYDEQLRQQLRVQTDAVESARPEIDSQLVLALEREVQKGRSHARPAAQPGRGTMLGIAGAVTALAIVAAVWASIARKTLVQPAPQAVATPLAGKGLGISDRGSGPKETASQPPVTNLGSQIPSPKLQIADLPSKIQNPKSKLPDSFPRPGAPTEGWSGEGQAVRVAPPPARPAMSAAEAAQVQRRWAEHLGLPAVGTNSLGVPLVLIPPGEFDMGSTPEEIAWALEQGKKNNLSWSYMERVPSEAPRHRVTMTKPFYLGMCAVTQSEYEKVMGVNPSAFTANPMDASAFQPPLSAGQRRDRDVKREKVADRDTSRHPVETVSWDEAMEFCHRFSAMPAEQAAHRVYRLPTEAEWEYACRAGTTTPWYCGSDDAALAEFAWFKQNAGSMTHPAGGKRPNAWGLYDMCGNIWQWCSDRFDAGYYMDSPVIDPAGPADGSIRVLRGACWRATPFECRSACRGYTFSGNRSVFHSFRVVVGD